MFGAKSYNDLRKTSAAANVLFAVGDNLLVVGCENECISSSFLPCLYAKVGVKKGSG